MASTRRKFLGSLVGLAGGGFIFRTLAQDNADVNQVRGMITPRAQEAIDAGLAYLARTQHENGSWGAGQNTGNLAVTSLCGLALMAGGSQPGRGPYGRHVSRALQFVMSQEDRGQAGFLVNHRASSHGPMYEHGFATLFLAEAHGMVNQRELRDRLRGILGRAVDLIVRTQNREGGWRYRPVQADADLSVTICQIMALRAARNAGIAVPKKTADKCIEYVKDCQDLRGTGGFRYLARQGGGVSFARSAAGVVALYSAGLYEGQEVDKGLKYMMSYKPGANNQGGGGFFGGGEYQTHYYYGHYYAAQAMWIAGGRYGREWFPAIRDELLNIRQGDHTWSDGRFDRHYCTAMALIILQIPNNYLPILQR